MLILTGLNINTLPFEELEKISELINFEGHPNLIHFKDNRNDNILAYWVDYNQNGVRWLYGKVSKQELFDYLIGKKSLRNLFKEITSEYTFLVDFNLAGSITAVQLITSYSIPEDYLPGDESFFTEGLSDFYLDYLTEFNYLHKLRESSYIFKVEPLSKKHQNTVGAKEAATVLNCVTNSIEGYIKVKAFNLYKTKYSDVSRINRKINKLKTVLSPRISETAFHSFEVWLAMDIYTFNGEDQVDSELRNSLVEDYKNDVLDVDFTSEEEAKIITEKFTQEERKIIYEPLLKIFESDDFTVSVSDRSKTLNKGREVARLNSAVREIIIPKPTLQEVEAEMAKKNKIVSIVINLKEGEDVTKISKKELFDNLIFKEEVAEAPFDIKTPIEYEGYKVNLVRDLRCSLKVDSNGNLQLYNSSLEIFAQGTDIHEITIEIKSQLVHLYNLFLKNPESADLKILELKKYLGL